MKKFADGSFVFTGTSCTHSLIHTHTHTVIYETTEVKERNVKKGVREESFEELVENTAFIVQRIEEARVKKHTQNTQAYTRSAKELEQELLEAC